MRAFVISADSAPPIGNIRTLGPDDRILIEPPMRERPDWCRYVDAVRHAVARGAEVRWRRG